METLCNRHKLAMQWEELNKDICPYCAIDQLTTENKRLRAFGGYATKDEHDKIIAENAKLKEEKAALKNLHIDLSREHKVELEQAEAKAQRLTEALVFLETVATGENQVDVFNDTEALNWIAAYIRETALKGES